MGSPLVRPLHDITIINIVWFTVYKIGVVKKAYVGLTRGQGLGHPLGGEHRPSGVGVLWDCGFRVCGGGGGCVGGGVPLGAVAAPSCYVEVSLFPHIPTHRVGLYKIFVHPKALLH